MIAKVQAWWRGLNRRERILTAIGGGVTVLALSFLIAIEPAWKARARLNAELPNLRAQAAEVQALADEARQLKGKGITVTSVDAAKSAMEKSLARANLNQVRIAVLDSRRLTANAKDVPVTQFLGWMEETTRESRLRVAAVRISRTPIRAVVDAQATFELTGPR